MISLDVGSCHLGSPLRAMEIISAAAATGTPEDGPAIVKFQLFPKKLADKGPNWYLPPEWWPALESHAQSLGVILTASVWDTEGVDLLVRHHAPWIKFAHSQRRNIQAIEYAVKTKLPVYVTCDPWDTLPMGAYPVWTHTVHDPEEREYHTQYPAENTDIVIRDLFAFCGVSLHQPFPVLKQLVSNYFGQGEWVELHMGLGDGRDQEVPDGQFCLTPAQVAEIRVLNRSNLDGRPTLRSSPYGA